MSATYRSLIALAVVRLSRARVEGARLDAEVLMMHLRGVDRTHLYLDLNDEAPNELPAAYEELIERRATGEPVAYITGRREFMGIELTVDARVLIPRPETEGMVERAVAWLDRHPEARRVVDVGTGSGAIAVAIVRFVGDGRSLSIVASDVSGDALDVARVNLNQCNAARIELVRGDLLSWCRGPIDLVVANLPYLREEQRHEGIAREPDLALYADQQGFALNARLLAESSRLLIRPGAVMCEIDPDQREVGLLAASEAFPGANIWIDTDLARLDRYLIVDVPDV
ncbi:MAG: peptide chain release factor N(5)-glutamine methyltransferase [Nitrolancea sp.]